MIPVLIPPMSNISSRGRRHSTGNAMFRVVHYCALTALALLAAAPSARAQAQSYPSKPVTIIVPLAAGTGMDTLARIYAEQLSQALGKPVVIENKPGAGLMLCTATIAAAPPDGHTLGISTATPMAVNQVLYKKLSYERARLGEAESTRCPS